MQFLLNLEFIIRRGLPVDKLVALRFCVKEDVRNKAAEEIKLAIRSVPVGNLQAIHTQCACLSKIVLQICRNNAILQATHRRI